MDPLISIFIIKKIVADMVSDDSANSTSLFDPAFGGSDNHQPIEVNQSSAREVNVGREGRGGTYWR